MTLLAKTTTALLILATAIVFNSSKRSALGLTLPIKDLPYAQFPSDEDEPPRTAEPRSWYSTAYCGKYLGYWQGRGEGSGSHPGVDLRIDTGTPIMAIARGRVIKCGTFWRWGNTVVIEHLNMPGIPGGEPIYSVYAHLSQLMVKDGDTVQEAEVIGLSGDSEIVNMPHLHFQIDKYVEGASHPFFPERNGQCYKCDWFDPRHVVNNPDSDDQVKRHTLNPIKYLLQFKDHGPVKDLPSSSYKPSETRPGALKEGRLYKGSNSEIYLYLGGALHLIPDPATLSIIGKGVSDEVTEIPDRALFVIPHVRDLPPLREGLLIRDVTSEVYVIQGKAKKLLDRAQQPGRDIKTTVLTVPKWVLESIPTGY
jgi:murein DD-endopeptidase MepM/ murein hydrolase activator NlpD